MEKLNFFLAVSGEQARFSYKSVGQFILLVESKQGFLTRVSGSLYYEKIT